MGKSSPRRTSAARHPELGVERAEVAGAERGQRDEHADTGRADEPEVEGERGL
jgi:hypothetical protein